MAMAGKMPLMLLLAVAALFSFWQLGRADVVTDEASHAVRAIGLVDFDFGIEQPTPWQWIQTPPPWWMRLSFHDHPVMLFLAQHLSIRALGETPLAARLPSALAGIASVIFVYLIGIQLYQRGLPHTVIARSPPKAGDEAISGIGRGPQIATPRHMSGLAMTNHAPQFAAIAAALLFAITVNHVWISRIGLFESLLIAFMLAAVWAFLRGLDNPQWLPLAGLLLGLAVLTKYLALILIPIFISIILLYRRQTPSSVSIYDRKHKRNRGGVVLAAVLFLAVASPVIIYNLQLWRNFGHFDFQFSQLFGQDVAAWPARPGQEVLGSYAERLRTFIPRLIEANSPYFLILSAAGLALIALQTLLYSFHDRRKSTTTLVTPVSPDNRIGRWLLGIVLVWLIPFLVFIGPAHRFLTLLTPWLALAAGYAIAQAQHPYILKNVRMLMPVAAVFAALVALEAFYSYNSVIALKPIGEHPWAYSYLHRQAGTWGFNQLEAYLKKELAGKMPDPAITFEFPFAREILQKSREQGRRQQLEAVPWAIVYNDNINLASQLWIFLRRITYHGWPVMSAENFRREGGAEFLRQAGVKKIYFINAAEAALQDRPRQPTPDGDIMEAELKDEGLRPKEIENPRGEVAFRVYNFDLR